MGEPVAAHKTSQKLATSIAYLSPTSAQRRFAIIVIAFQFVACAVVAPFAVPVPRIDSFIPVILSIVFIADLLTAVLLFNHASVTDSRALLVLANGYLFSALIIVPHALTFPGAFAPKGLLGAGVQSSGWLNAFWHVGFLISVIGYVLLKGNETQENSGRTLSASAIWWSVAIQFGLVCALTWSITTGDRFVPRLFFDDLTSAPLLRYTAGMIVLISALTLILTWTRRASALDLWIMVVLCMLISEMALVTFGFTSRFYLGWYVARTLAVAVSAVVLIALLSQSMRLQTELAHTNTMLERERENKLMNMQAVTASLAHELKQPLTAICVNGEAAQLFLNRVDPNLEQAQSALDSIIADGHRASRTIDDLRTLFARTDKQQEPTDVNEVILEALRLLGAELNAHSVVTEIALGELPSIMGHKGQLQEVMVNLLQNAIEAMGTTNGRRSLRLSTEQRDASILVEVKDSGPGIDRTKLNRIFDAFFTTKTQGTGLGLAICRMIINRHGGKISASSDGGHGTLFQVTLPTSSAHKARH